MGLRASTFEKKKKKWQGCQFFKFLIFFYLNFKVLQKMILRAQFLLHLQVLYSKMFVIFTGMLPYNLKKNRVKRGEGGQNGGKTPLLVKKKTKKLFFGYHFYPKIIFTAFFDKN